ncbi:hypothetical protein ACSBQN_14020 [Morganella sp. B601]|uniref:hypothetical protein n=1 Tax=Morganella TaxID=581 RepID=UPI00339C24F1
MTSKYRKTINFKSKELFDKIESISKAMGCSESNFLEGIIQDWYIKNREKEPQTLTYPVYLDTNKKELHISRYHLIKSTTKEINFYKDDLILYSNNKKINDIFIYGKLENITSNMLTNLYDTDDVDFYIVIVKSAKIYIKNDNADNNNNRFSMRISIDILPIPILYKNETIPDKIKNLDISKIKYNTYKDELTRIYKSNKKRFLIADTGGRNGAYFIEKGTLTDSDIKSVATKKKSFNLVIDNKVIEMTFKDKSLKDYLYNKNTFRTLTSRSRKDTQEKI